MECYLGVTLGFSGGSRSGAIYATTAIAAMISPLYIGFLADRMFATEKMIGVLHLLGAGLLAAAAVVTDFQTLRAIMVAYAICYMPTLALTNSISFANITDPEREFPGIRVFGTWGWIVAGWIVGFIFGNPDFAKILPESIAHGNAPVFLAAGLSAICAGTVPAFRCCTLRRAGVQQTDSGRGSGIRRRSSGQCPATAGRSVVPGVRGVLIPGLHSAVILLRVCHYMFLTGEILTLPTRRALQTIGQLSEVGFMAAMPYFIARLGVKKMLAVGMLAWVARYFCFGSLQFPLIVVGLFLHGVCYDFFFVASQIYVDSRANSNQRASAQSFIAFVTMGVGMFVGAYFGGEIVDTCTRRRSWSRQPSKLLSH